MKLLNFILGYFISPKREALIGANKTVSKKTQAEECNKELYSWLKKNNGSIGIPVK